jgi:N6-adenosine-specific RNA methylase IME4
MSLFEPSPFQSLPERQARVILCDPPWSFKNYSAKGEAKNPNQHYACMEIAEIAALPVAELVDPTGCVLVMWCTWPFLPAGLDLMSKWGFIYKTGGAWIKQGTSGKIAFGPGYIYRAASEFWLVGTIGNPKRQSRSVRNAIIAPNREHSRKPDQMRADIERLWPGPYIELFAREPAPGWMAWGNETQKFAEAAE